MIIESPIFSTAGRSDRYSPVTPNSCSPRVTILGVTMRQPSGVKREGLRVAFMTASASSLLSAHPRLSSKIHVVLYLFQHEVRHIRTRNTHRENEASYMVSVAVGTTPFCI